VRTCCLTHLARTLSAPTKVNYRLKRFWRFLDNEDALAPADSWRQSGSWGVEQFAHRPRWVIALDATYLGNRWLLLAAMGPWKGRALPLQWAAYRLDALPKSQPQREEDFLKEWLDWLPRERKRVVLVADRGYARPQWLKWLKKRQVAFVMRLPGNYRVTAPAYRGKLNQMPLRKGQGIWWAEVVVTDARPVRVNLRVVWAQGEAEPWYLATTLPAEQEVRRFYRQRMRIEQAFRDGKSHFKVGALKRWENRAHVERMLAVGGEGIGRLVAASRALLPCAIRRSRTASDGRAAEGMARPFGDGARQPARRARMVT
jgi:hypothetical protein